jgi:hypothetical protein
MKTLAFILAFFASSVFAQEVWLEVASSKTMIVHGKNVQPVSKGMEMVVRQTKGSDIEFYVVQIESTTCKNQYGKLYFYELSRKFAFSADYVNNGGTVGSAVGDWLCLFIDNSGTTKGKSL